MKYAWVFAEENGQRYGVYRTFEDAVETISALRLEGMVTAYPVGISVFGYYAALGRIDLKPPHTSKKIANFTSAQMTHYHLTCDEYELPFATPEDSDQLGAGWDEQESLVRKQPLSETVSLLWLAFGDRNRNPSAVFESQLEAETWLRQLGEQGQVLRRSINAEPTDVAEPPVVLI